MGKKSDTNPPVSGKDLLSLCIRPAFDPFLTCKASK
jgi:hypothetical protein